MASRKRVEITGVVQGVGFRPFVHRLAGGCGLGGFVLNSPRGVTIEVEGAPAALEEFVARLEREPPPLAHIESLLVAEIPPGGGPGFEIRASETGARDAVAAEVSPDAAPCAACRADYHDPANRRFAYPFTNCTHCGPRYTITRALPYDRPQTTMATFVQCVPCQREYEDPGARRFHAQPNACPDCGPRLELGDVSGPQALQRARELLADGKIVALKNVGGYQLACDAGQPAVVERLRRLKRRGAKPFALLARDLRTVERICVCAADERTALLSRARPIVLLRRSRNPAFEVATAVAPGQPHLGVMLASSPLHDLLFVGEPRLDLLVMTSGNRGAEPIARTNAEAHVRLEGIADAFLDHNRDIHVAADDSVSFCFEGRERLLRRARGYAPQAVDLGPEDADAACVLAAGAELKNTFCLAVGRQAFLSPHLGDMENLEAYGCFERVINHYLKMHGARPKALAYDPHPGYQVSRLARRLAQELGIERQLAVQHHHAHIAGCMAENGLRGAVLGVAWDGTGYGLDGHIWGGEFLVADRNRFARAAHLRPVKLVGGDRAVRQPWRVGLSYLFDALGAERGAAAARALWPRRAPGQLALAGRLLECPGLGVACSSAGRLFDAVAALLGLAPEESETSFEAEAALALENAARRDAAENRDDTPRAAAQECAVYTFALGGDSPCVLDWRPIVAEMMTDRRRGLGIEAMALKFHATLAEAIAAMCGRLRQDTALNRVCLSGGGVQNRLLLTLAVERLRGRGFEVFLHAATPANDGGLALGQAVVARAVLQRERGGVCAWQYPEKF